MPRVLRLLAPLLFVCLGGAPLLVGQIDEGIRLTVAPRLAVFGTVGGPTTQTASLGVSVSEPGCSLYEIRGANVPWLTLSKRSGAAWSPNGVGDGVTITIDYSTFQPNETRTTFAVFESYNTPPNQHYCRSPQPGTNVYIFAETLEITATLLPAGPRPSPVPSPMILSLSDSTGSQQPISTFLDMTNAADGSYSYVFEVAYSGAASGWLSVSPPSGTVNSTPVRHQVSANPVGLQSGTYNAVLRVLHDAAGAPTITIPVSLTLSGPPRLLVTPSTTITGTARRGKQNANSVSLSVSNSGGGTLAYQIASSVPWMTVTPPQGESSGTPVAHTVAFTAQTLPVGVHTASLTISSSTPGVANSPVVVPVSIDVKPGGTISVTPAEAPVTVGAGSSERKQIRLRLESPELDKLQWRARTDPAPVQWLRLLDAGGSLPGTIVAEVDAAVLPRPATVTAAIVVEAFDPADVAALGEEGPQPEQPAAAIIRTIVPVRLQVVAQEPELTVAPTRVEFIAAPGGGPRVQPIAVSMGGGAPALTWQASLETRRGASSNVFRIAPTSGVGPGTVTVSADPVGLTQGVYDADVVLTSGSTVRRVPVAMLVSGPSDAIVSTGQTAVAIRGSAAALPVRIPVANLGAGVTPNVQVNTTMLAGAGWLTATPSGAGAFITQAAGTGLQPGVVHGLVEITAPGATNSPLYLPVVYEREGPGAAADLALDRGGLVFVSVGGAAAAAQSIQVATTLDTALRTLVGVSTESGLPWLSASPVDEQISARTPLTVNVQVNAAGLAPGVHRGRVNFAIRGGPSQSASVTLVVAPSGPCTPTSVVVAPLAPPDGFRATTGHPVTVEAGLLDDCGFPVRGGVTVAGAARGAILRDMGESGGQARGPQIFRGTMVLPVAGAADIHYFGAGSNLAPSDRRLSGTAVDGADGATGRSSTPPVHAATFGLGRPLAPGSIATVFGAGFPTPAQQPSTLPLPEALSGFSVRVAGKAAPLFFLNATQANLQIPVETPANTLVQSLVGIGQSYLPTETFFSANAQPGLFALSEGRAVVVNQDGTVNTPLNPARRGQVVVAYLTGVGATTPASVTNQAAPGAEPFARAALPASASIGGVPAEIHFLGMTPGLVGLTQANLTIGAGVSTGANVPFILEVGGYQSPQMSIAVEP